MLRPIILERFNAQIDQHGPVASHMRSHCWVWTGALNGNGYGVGHKIAGAQTPAHRVSWMVHHGPIPDGLCVLHQCDNRQCVRPDHLYLGTKAQNAADASARQRFPYRKGTKHNAAKLTERDVLDIRASADAGAHQRWLGTLYGITQANVSRIVRRQTWSHI